MPTGLTVSEQTRDIRGGLLVKQGDIETNCAVETIASGFRSEMASQVAAAMF
jgi:V/A-type H+-transporting ATPase subunit E